MSPIEQEVREMLRTKVSQAPVHDEPPPVVLRRTKTLRAVNGVGILATAAAVVLGIVLGAQTFGDRNVVEPTTPGKPIPWANLPADHPGESARPCRAKDVNLYVTGTGDRFILFRPGTAASVCSFTFDQGSIQILDLNGRNLGVQIRNFQSRVELGGGMGAHTINYEWSNYCGTPTPMQMRLTMSDGGGVLQATALGGASPPCDDRSRPSTIALGTTGISVHPRDEIDPAYLDVTFSLNAPSTVRRGSTLRYQVILTNNIDTDIPLDPCPIFNHAIVGDPVSEPGGGPFYLNCDAAPDVIPARGSLAFQIEFPGLTTAGPKTLLWSLQTMEAISVPIQIL